jgi:hypothetical protein
VARINPHHVFFCRFRVPAPVVFVDGVLDREAFVDAFSSFWTSSIARFCRPRVRNTFTTVDLEYKYLTLPLLVDPF